MKGLNEEGESLYNVPEAVGFVWYKVSGLLTL